jgi:hypothetical protein
VLPLIIAQVAEQRLSPALKLLLTHVGGQEEVSKPCKQKQQQISSTSMRHTWHQ